MRLLEYVNGLADTVRWRELNVLFLSYSWHALAGVYRWNGCPVRRRVYKCFALVIWLAHIGGSMQTDGWMGEWVRACVCMLSAFIVEIVAYTDGWMDGWVGACVCTL